MEKSRSTEAELLGLTASKLISDGYDVILHPRADALPKELQGFSPDAIAIGKLPYLVVEVKSEGYANDDLRSLRQAVETSGQWQLYVVFNNSKSSIPLQPMSLREVREHLEVVRSAAAMDTRAA